MAQVINFFPKQSYPSNTTLYSAPYDMSQFVSLCVEFRVIVFSGTGNVTVTLEDTSDAEMDPNSWGTLNTAQTLGAPGTVRYTNGSNLPHRFVRCKLVVPGTNSAILYVQGIAREST